MTESGHSSSEVSEEYFGEEEIQESDRPRSRPLILTQAPSQASLRPWEDPEVVDTVHRKLEDKQSNRRSNRITKESYTKTSKTCIKAIRKNNRNVSSSGNSSKLTSPETNTAAENPFTFAHALSTSSVPGQPPPKVSHPPHHASRNRKSKKRNKDRSYDRDLKLLGADYDRGGPHPTTGDMGFKPAYEVETSSRFLSLASRPVEKEDSRETTEKSIGFRRQSLSRSASKWPNCPKDRIKFYEYFSVLIELGSKAKRKREEQLRKNIPCQTPEAWRNELHDVLWLELQAWMRNQDMHYQDMHLMLEREKIDDILKSIMHFRIDDPEISAPCSDGNAEIDDDYVKALHAAYKLVGAILHQLDEVEHLYPCTKKIGLSHALYDRAQFQDKVKALIMWTNFYIQLSYRLQAVTGVICGRKTNDVFPSLPTSLEEDVDGDCKDVVDGLGDAFGDLSLAQNCRSGFSSRASSYHDLSQFDEPHVSKCPITAALRVFLEKSMRKRGLEKTIMQIQTLVFPTLKHILMNLAQPVSSAFLNRQTSAPEGQHVEVDIVKMWCDLHKDSNLPCLDRVFVHLLRLPILTLKEGIALRLEQRPEAEADLASLNQLIHECKDTLIIAIKIRSDYIELGHTIHHHEVMVTDIRGLDEQMKKLLELYLDYLQQWILTLQKEAKASRLQKSILEDEWKFMTQLCGGIEDAELELPKMFCAIVQGLLSGIGSLLDSGLDDFISSLYHGGDSMGRDGQSPSRDMFRQFFRECKAVFLEARERCFKLLEFTKLLHKDLEIAAVYELLVSTSTFLNTLAVSKHYELEFTCTDLEREGRKFRFFVSPSTANNLIQIGRLLNAIMGAREQDADWDGYLLIVPTSSDKWGGKSVKIDAGALTAIRHSHIEIDIGHVMMVVIRNSVLSAQSKQFEKRFPNKDCIKSSIPQTTCHQLISQDLEQIKEESLELGKKVCAVILRVEDNIGAEQFPEASENDRSLVTKVSRELLHQSYNFCIEYHRELARLNFNDEEVLARQLFFLARQWMQFVIKKCERGHGTRPRWSTPGLDYLTVAVRPNYTRCLSDEEFTELKTMIDHCVSHVIGDQPPPGVKTPVESPTSFYLSPPQSSLQLHRSSLSLTDGLGHLGIPSRMSSKSDTASYDSSEDDDSESMNPHHRVEEATAKMDKKRNDKLVESRAVGQVVPTEKTKTLSHLKARKVDFRWRLCSKLGSGRHADVYKVMNLNTNGLLAVKRFQVSQANLAERITRLATEIEWLAGLKHPNVVQYFGVEIQRDELLLFMEYCDGGTLSDVARQGLDLIMVRVYTKQLLMGICYLHENGICHLDIKGQNVFLTSGGLVKLGDFSEMVKMEDGHTKTNEITANTGTPRYMSPEMVRGDEVTKIGRASDIWSLGCVVVEMITGKTPKFEKEDNEFAIMFHVASGGRPKIPDTLSADAKDFLNHCFEKEPQDRWKADKLLNHSFVTVDIGDVHL